MPPGRVDKHGANFRAGLEAGKPTNARPPSSQLALHLIALPWNAFGVLICGSGHASNRAIIESFIAPGWLASPEARPKFRNVMTDVPRLVTPKWRARARAREFMRVKPHALAASPLPTAPPLTLVTSRDYRASTHPKACMHRSQSQTADRAQQLRDEFGEDHEAGQRQRGVVLRKR